MPTETNVQQVKVNLMTQAQYDEADKNLNEFYVITDQDYVTETELESKGYLTEHQDISNLATKGELTTGLSDKQDVISDLETIREGASKGSTALQSVPSEYVTETELESKGYLTSYTETDPIYTVDKPNLALKSEIPNVPTNVSAFTNDVGYLTSVPSEYVTETELNNKGYLTEHQDISNLATKEEVTTGLSGKQNIISDLETIREGASKGSTALQSVPSEYVTETELESKGYLTSYTETDPVYSADKPNLALKSEIPDISNLATKDEIPDVSGKADKSTTYTKTEIDNIISSKLGNIETLLSEV